MKNPYSVEELQRIIGTAQGYSRSEPQVSPVDQAQLDERPDRFRDDFGAPQPSQGLFGGADALAEGPTNPNDVTVDWSTGKLVPVAPNKMAPEPPAPPPGQPSAPAAPPQEPGTVSVPSFTTGGLQGLSEEQIKKIQQEQDAKPSTYSAVDQEGAGTPVQHSTFVAPAAAPKPLAAPFIQSDIAQRNLPLTIRAANLENQMSAEHTRRSNELGEKATATAADAALKAAAAEQDMEQKMYQANQERITAQKDAAKRAERAEMIAGIFDSVGQLFEDQKQYNTTIMAAAFAGAGKPELAVELVKSAQNQNYLAQRNAIDRARMRGQQANNALERMRQAAGDERIGDLMYKQATVAATQKRLAAAAQLDMSPSRREAIQAAYRANNAQLNVNKYKLYREIAEVTGDPVRAAAFNQISNAEMPARSVGRIGERLGFKDQGTRTEETVRRYQDMLNHFKDDPEALKIINEEMGNAVKAEVAAAGPAEDMSTSFSRSGQVAGGGASSLGASVGNMKAPKAAQAPMGKQAGVATKGSGAHPVEGAQGAYSSRPLTAQEKGLYGPTLINMTKAGTANAAGYTSGPVELARISSNDDSFPGPSTVLVPKGRFVARIGSQYYSTDRALDAKATAEISKIRDPNATLLRLRKTFSSLKNSADNLRAAANGGASDAELEKLRMKVLQDSVAYDTMAKKVTAGEFHEIMGTLQGHEAKELKDFVDPMRSNGKEWMGLAYGNFPTVAAFLEKMAPLEKGMKGMEARVNGFIDFAEAKAENYRGEVERRYGLVPETLVQVRVMKGNTPIGEQYIIPVR